MPQRGQGFQHLPHVRSAGIIEVLRDLFDGERGVRVRHDGADGFGAGREAGRPVERLGGGAVPTHLDVQLQLGLRLDGLGGLVRGPKVTGVALLFLRPPLGVEV